MPFFIAKSVIKAVNDPGGAAAACVSGISAV